MNFFDVVIIQPIFNILIGIYSLIPGGDIGVTLIIFTIIVRFALYPLVKRQLHQTKMMRKLQPQLKEIKKNANGNRQLEAMQMMDLYKRNGVSPFRSIGILLIQLPIFFGLFYAIRILTVAEYQKDIAKYAYDFLENIGPIHEIIKNPDHINHLMLGFIDLSKVAVGKHGLDIALLVLAVLSAVTQYIMSKQTMPQEETKKTFKEIMQEAGEGKKADQSEMNAVVMQKMIKLMPIMMFFIMLNLPGALALYYTVSNIIAVIQQHFLLKKDEDELEELANKPSMTTKKSSNTKTREKNAKEAHVTRIVAKDPKANKRR